MSDDTVPAPKQFLGVTVSSTFTDLQEHRAAVIKAIKALGLTDVAMENDAAKHMDVIDSSLQMVQDGAAYIGIISLKYGQIPKCRRRNPNNLSVTELEFNEAQRLGRPVLLFIMGENHPVLGKDVESNASKRRKLNAFRERAKKKTDESEVHRVYATFDSLEEFKEQLGTSLANLRPHLEAATAAPGATRAKGRRSSYDDPIPRAPDFYAEPAYIGSHNFVGRQAQLDALNDWAQPADAHSVLLFDAIGGNGKSMLTWEWTTRHATEARPDWAGRFWYSFYEKGAIMADFCRRALAYTTGSPLKRFYKKRTPELSELLLRQLKARPWLFVLDGLERVLVAYHRIDAAEVRDEEANTPTDTIVNRDPCSAIRPEDDDLLRTLASAAPSKLLVTSRLVPQVLLNKAGQPIPGVQRVSLPGLRPADAEVLLRSCNITGDSRAIQSYLTSNCDCHPLVIGVLAGLINDYLPDKGNFDAWAADPAGGGRLNLADLDLIQKRNHILKAGLDAIPEERRQLLSTLALLPEAADYATLSAFNPHLPPEPEEVDKPQDPERSLRWGRLSEEERALARQRFQTALDRRKEYEEATAARLRSAEYLTAPQELANTVRDLERRGLLQYDGRARRYDLHPVVRGIASGGLQAEERNRHGQRVVDYFSRQAHDTYEQAGTLEDVRAGLNIVRTLLKMERFKEACSTLLDGMMNALLFNLESHAECLSLLRPFFPTGWDKLPNTVDNQSGDYLVSWVALALERQHEPMKVLALHGVSLTASLNREDSEGVSISLSNISTHLRQNARLSVSERISLLGQELASLSNNREALFIWRLDWLSYLSLVGRWADAEVSWLLLDPMGRNWSRTVYRPGEAECCYALFRLEKGDLREEHLAVAERLATDGKNRQQIRHLHALRGKWQLQQGNWSLAAESLHEAVRMARSVGAIDAEAETRLTLAKFHLGQLTDPRQDAEQLSQLRGIDSLALAELWLALGDREQAKKHALTTYKFAWANGEPYVLRYELTKATTLLQQLGAEIPKLPPYDPAKDEEFPWEDKVVAFIEELRAKKQAKENKKT